jgi:hypothetical protein
MDIFVQNSGISRIYLVAVQSYKNESIFDICFKNPDTRILPTTVLNSRKWRKERASVSTLCSIQTIQI